MKIDVIDHESILGVQAEVFECFWRPELWPQITPHVKRIEMIHETENHQRFIMEVHAEGKKYVMESERSALAPQIITYQQSKPPAIFRSHGGEWRFEQQGPFTQISLVHSVDVDDEKAVAVLEVKTVEEAYEKIRTNLKKNGRTTINAVKKLVESGQSNELLQKITPALQTSTSA